MAGTNGRRGYEELVENALNGIYQCGEDGRFLRVNPALVRLLGYATEEELHATSLQELLTDAKDVAVLTEQLNAADDIASVEVALQGRGSLVDALLNARAIRAEDGSVLCHEGILTDISRLKRQEEELVHLATHDPLTGLHNRREFNSILERHLAR
ncbi:PAS domain S-box protein, partial [Candidatus Bipolaricaulota bacterium]|nr:PAS domain S-box protein [Candidatus Bipolaricaulota bacterium]